MPSVAFCIAIGIGAWWLGEKFLTNLPFNAGLIILGIVFVFYAIKTNRHLPVWQSNETLF